jgi:MFS family permease
MPASGSEPDTRDNQFRRVAVACFVGTAIEWYDFFIYGIASAFVLGPLFFPPNDATTAAMLAFATFGIGFVARPVGGIIAGHLGDRVGRKAVLVATLVLMGLATAGVGLIPTYQQVGVGATILLVSMRLLQGLSAGGEWGGAALMAVEHAPPDRRGLWGSSAQVGVPVGLIMASGAFFAARASMNQQQFMSFGWRIPFVASLALVVVGLYIRLGVSESPVFTEVRRAQARAKRPLLDAARRHPRQVVIAMLSFVATNAAGYILVSFLSFYGVTTLKLDQGTMLKVVIGGAAAMFAFIVIGGRASDQIGRRRVYLIGYAILAAWAFPCFALLDTRSMPLMLLAVIGLGTGVGLTYGPQAAFFAELFDPDVRYSGASVSYALGALLGGAFAPLLATALVANYGTGYAVSAYIALLSVISLVSVLPVREADLQFRRQRDQYPAAPGVEVVGR